MKGGDDPVIESLSVTANGTYTAGEGVDGYSPVTVALPLSYKTITANGFYNAISDNVEGYNAVIVNIPMAKKTITSNGAYAAKYDNKEGYTVATVDVPFYPREDTPLDLLTSIETMDMHTEPTTGAGTLYYPIVYLASVPYPNPEQEDPTDRGKYFAPTDANYAVTAYIDIINKGTGESVEGYPQIVNTSSANYGINSGGYIRLKGWKVVTSGNHLKVSVTTTRWNTTYSNPIDNTYSTQSDVETWLSAYTTPPYVIKSDVAQGKCGTNATFILNKRTGLLEINGTGEISWVDGYSPWSDLLKQVTIANGITGIGADAFSYTTNLASITIPSSVTSISDAAFYYSNVSAITILSSEINIAEGAFSRASNITNVTMMATTPPQISSALFYYSMNTLQAIYVPAESVDTYKAASGWSTYASLIQAIPSGD